MKLQGSYTFQAPREQVWQTLVNPQSVQKALPGCEKLEEQAPGKYDVFLKIGVAAVKGSYKGKFELSEMDPPARTRMTAEGRGLPGHIKIDARMELAGGENQTVISYDSDVQVGGLIAGIGQRMLSGIAKMMVEQFFKNVEKQLQAP